MAATVAQEEQPISRTYQYRKVMKPMLERKRRARINSSLDQLKELLVGALQAEGESVSRLEKADILELTVRHLQKLRRNQQLSENSASERFRQGFVHCATEVSHFSKSFDLSVSTRLVSHLDQCIRSIESSQLHHQQLLHPSAMPPPQQGSPRSSQLSPGGYPVSVSGAMMSPVGPGGLNILTSYTPPSSPVSSSSSPSSNGGGGPHHQKIYYIPGASSSASSTGSLSPIPPAHYNTAKMYAVHAHGGLQPLSLCTKSSLNSDEEPFDLSNNVWRPW